MVFTLVSCGGDSANSGIAGNWIVESTEFDGGFVSKMAAEIYEDCGEIEITKDGKYLLLGQVATYNLSEDSYIEITDNMGATSRNKYELTEDTLKIYFLDGKTIVNFKRK